MTIKHSLWLSLLVLCSAVVNAHAKQTLHENASDTAHVYQFGKHKPQAETANLHLIQSQVEYNSQRGYGFDFDSAQHVNLQTDGMYAEQSVYFSVKLPAGQYQVELTLGSHVRDSNNTVKAESRRLMINQRPLKKAQIHTQILLIDVRTPQINATEQIGLDEREINELNWDDKLTLEFSAQSAVQSITIQPINHVPTLYLAGDSTVTDQDVEPWASWGQLFTQYINDKVVVANYAVSGASLFSFKASKRLDKVMSLIKPGDYLFIQFAHNDEKRKGEGIGPWQSYTQLLTEYVELARAKGGVPVLLTPVQRRFFNADGSLKPTHGDYPAAVRAVAAKLNAALIDLTQLTTTLYQSWGDELSRQAFVQYPADTFPNQTKALKDNTHFNYFGANEIALCVIRGLVDSESGLVKYLDPAFLTYDPQKPNKKSDWTVPMSPRFTATKPDGS